MPEPTDPLILAGTGLKFVLYAAAVFVTGTLATIAAGIVEPNGARRWLVRAAWGGAALLVIAAARFGLLLLQMGDPALAAMIWQVQAPATSALILGAVVAMLAGIPQNGLLRAVTCGVGAAAIATSFALTGHAQALETPGLVPIVVAGHVLLASFWVAAVWVLWPSDRLASAVLRSRVERFGAIALFAVPPLMAGGVFLGLQLGGGLSGLTGSLYGATLAAKALVAGAALAVGAGNKWRVTPLLRSDPGRGRQHLRRALLVDAFLFSGALVAIALATTLYGPAL